MVGLELPLEFSNQNEFEWIHHKVVGIKFIPNLFYMDCSSMNESPITPYLLMQGYILFIPN